MGSSSSVSAFSTRECPGAGQNGVENRGGVSGREVAHGLGHVVAEGQRCESGRGDAVVDVALDVLPTLLRRAVDDQLVDERVRDGVERALAVAVLPLASTCRRAARPGRASRGTSRRRGR